VVQELLLGGQAGTVDTVIVDGRVVLRGGEPQQVDAEAVIAKGREAARRVLGRAGFTPTQSWPVVD
jgi:5-methylthioadenosine/S-adenosylhomocysteine deaminase